MPAERILTGVEGLDRSLNELKLGVANRVARSALTKAARVGAKRFKAVIPSSYKSVRRTVSSRGRKDKKTKQWTAKFGAGVGKSRAKSSKSDSGGVGISGRNVHWIVLGTKERRQKSGRYTGRMPAIFKGLLKVVASAASSEIGNVIKSAVRDGIQREAAKARAKGKSIT